VHGELNSGERLPAQLDSPWGCGVGRRLDPTSSAAEIRRGNVRWRNVILSRRQGRGNRFDTAWIMVAIC